MNNYQKTVDDYYLRQSKGASYFQGPAYQKGYGLGGIFRALMRVATHIFCTATPVVKAGARAEAKDAIMTGAQIANDALAGRDLTEAMQQRSREAADRLVNKGSKRLISMIERPASHSRKNIKAARRRDVFDN